MNMPVWQNPETSPFRGARMKLERSEQHLGDLRLLIDDYMNRKPYTVDLRQEVTGGDIEAFLSVHEDVPVMKWALFIGDVIHNLRSSLDLIACSLNRLEVENADCDNKSAFPIFKSHADFIKGCTEKLSQAHPDAVALIGEFQPYLGGTDLFYQISMFDNMDKHRLLIPALALPSEIAFHFALVNTEGGTLEQVFPLEPAFSNGAGLVMLHPVNCTIHLIEDAARHVALKVVISQPGIIDLVEALSFLESAVGLVSGVLDKIETWAFWEYSHLSVRYLNRPSDQQDHM